MKTIRVSEETWKGLQMLKINRGFRSMDQVIGFLLEKYNEYIRQTFDELLQNISGGESGGSSR